MELLLQVNNQRQIVLGAVELIRRQSSDPSTKKFLESAVFKTSKLLNTHFQEAISIQPAPNAAIQTDSPVISDGA